MIRRLGRILILGQFSLVAAADAHAQASAARQKAASPAPAAAPLAAQRQSLAVRRTAIQQALHGTRGLRLLSNGQSIAIDPTSGPVRAFPGDFVYGSTGAGLPVLTSHDGISVWQLPWRIWPVASDGSLPQRLRIDIEVDGVGLSYSKTADVFAGTIQVGVIDELHPGRDSLLYPVGLALLGTVDSLDPTSLSIPHTSIPFTRVRLVAREPGDNVTVRIRTDFDAVGREIRVPVVRPRLRLRATPSRIDGFGLESTTLLVILGGTPSSDSVSVTLSATGGHLEQEQVWVRPGEAAKAVLWSRGLGSSSVTAETPDQFRDSLAVSYRFPWLFLVAILVGGACGSAIRQGYQAIKKGQWPATTTFVKEMLIGVAAGGLLAVMQSVGINLLKFAPKGGGEAAVGVFAAVGAILGSALVDLITKSAGAGAGGTQGGSGSQTG